MMFDELNFRQGRHWPGLQATAQPGGTGPGCRQPHQACATQWEAWNPTRKRFLSSNASDHEDHAVLVSGDGFLPRFFNSKILTWGSVRCSCSQGHGPVTSVVPRSNLNLKLWTQKTASPPGQVPKFSLAQCAHTGCPATASPEHALARGRRAGWVAIRVLESPAAA